MNNKKILIIIGFIVIVFGLSFALYWVFFRSAPEKLDQNQNFSGGNIPTNIANGNISIINQNTNTNQGFPWEEYLEQGVSTVANGGLTAVNKISDNTVSSLISGLNGLQYYDATNQQFYRINPDGSITALSDQKFYQVQSVTWSERGEKAILEYPDGTNILYNFDTKKQVTLPREMEDFSFNTSGSQIAAKWVGDNADNNWIIAANDDGSGMFLVEPIGDQANDVIMGYSPDNQVAALYRKYTDSQNQEVYPIGLHGEEYNSFSVAGAGFTSTWSPDGSSLLYSVYNEDTNYAPNLWVTKGNTSDLGDLKVSLNVSTWPDKCTFADGGTLYCAVPQGLPRGAGFYPELADKYPDNFYRIDLNSGNKTLLASPVGESGSYAAYNLFTSSDGSFLYFVDKNTGKLQNIRLK